MNTPYPPQYKEAIMTALRRLVPLLLVLTLSSFVSAQNKTNVSWKFKEGQTFYQQQALEFDNVTSVGGQDIKMTGKETWYFSWTLVRQNADKSWQVRLVPLAIKLQIDVAGQKLALDTTGKPADDDELTKTFRGFINSEFTMTVAPDGQIKKFEGFKEAMDKLAKTAPNDIEKLKKFITEDSIKQWVAIVLCAMPGKEISKGDAWKTKTTMAMNPLGKVHTSNTFTADGDGKLKIDLLPEVEVAKDAELSEGVKVTKADLKSSGTGTLLYDAAKGRVSSADITFTLTGTLAVTVGTDNAELKLNQKVKMTTKFLDKDPLKEQ